jgi:hypothetical protein
MEDEVKRAAVGSGTAGPRRLTAGKLTGQKPALKMKAVWSIRTRLELEGDVRNLVLFNLAIDSKLRGCDLVRLKVGDVAAGGQARNAGRIYSDVQSCSQGEDRTRLAMKLAGERSERPKRWGPYFSISAATRAG